MAGWDVTQLLLLAGDARHLPFRRLRVVTTHAQGVETTTITTTVVGPTTIVVLTTKIVTVDFVTTIFLERSERVRP